MVGPSRERRLSVAKLPLEALSGTKHGLRHSLIWCSGIARSVLPALVKMRSRDSVAACTMKNNLTCSLQTDEGNAMTPWLPATVLICQFPSSVHALINGQGGT